MRKRLRLTARRLDGLNELYAILDGVQSAGWEGTPADTNHDDPERIKLGKHLDEAMDWLGSFILDEMRKRRK
jgi:hypothetical protein